MVQVHIKALLHMNPHTSMSKLDQIERPFKRISYVALSCWVGGFVLFIAASYFEVRLRQSTAREEIFFILILIFFAFLSYLLQLSKANRFWTPMLSYLWRFYVILTEVVAINVLHYGLYSKKMGVRTFTFQKTLF